MSCRHGMISAIDVNTVIVIGLVSVVFWTARALYLCWRQETQNQQGCKRD